jgi:hypothetical protein
MSTATPVNQIAGIVQATRNYFDTGVTKSHAWRVTQLKALSRMMSENSTAVRVALILF